jgi:DeoR family fructose operon transcriptional repressor
MVGAAHLVVVLVDSSKIGQEHMVRFARVADIDVVVTDAGISDADRAALERLDVEVVVA